MPREYGYNPNDELSKYYLQDISGETGYRDPSAIYPGMRQTNIKSPVVRPEDGKPDDYYNPEEGFRPHEDRPIIRDSNEDGEELKPPDMPEREWYEYLPFLNQGFEDKMAKYQTEYEQYALQDQRKYDSMVSQVERLKEAGLNPNLAYSMGESISGGKAESFKPSSVVPGIGEIIKGVTNMAGLGAHIRNLDSITKLNITKGATEAKQQGLLDSVTAGNIINNQFSSDTFDARVAKEKLTAVAENYRIKATKHDIALKEQLLDNANVQNEILEATAVLAKVGLKGSDERVSFLYMQYHKMKLKYRENHPKGEGFPRFRDWVNSAFIEQNTEIPEYRELPGIFWNWNKNKKD